MSGPLLQVRVRQRPLRPWHFGTQHWHFTRPLVLGVLNASPDSFSGSDAIVETPTAAVARGEQLLHAGADMVDIGGASSHPRAQAVSAETEWQRLRPLVQALAAAALPFSIDTQRPEVAAAALAAGASLINDVSGAPCQQMAQLAAAYGVPLVLTYRGAPPAVTSSAAQPSLAQHMRQHMKQYFAQQLAAAQQMHADMLILDPGYGFGKSLTENIAALRALPTLHTLHCPILICTSRKGSLTRLAAPPAQPQDKILPAPLATPPVTERLGASIASACYGLLQGAELLRVHDVTETVQFLRAWCRLHSEHEDPPP